MARAFVWLGGAMFVASLALCAYDYLIVWGRTGGPAGLSVIAANALLLTVFAAHHSLFARDRVKAWLSRTVPQPMLRSVYVWVASVLLMVVCLLWRPIGGELYHAAGLRAIAPITIQLAGAWFVARAVARIDPLDLAGIRAAPAIDGLQTSGPYRWVRHPLYFGWVLAVFGTPHMTGDRLAFAAITTLYLVIAVPWEERSLTRSFGEQYVRYARDVKWRMIPFIY
jgi:protein-S-isoprenylcysteine O-methyltransferase Ste14